MASSGRPCDLRDPGQPHARRRAETWVRGQRLQQRRRFGAAVPRDVVVGQEHRQPRIFADLDRGSQIRLRLGGPLRRLIEHRQA